MDKLTKQIIKSALANGAAVVGFAPLSRYDDAPAEYHPRTIFPQAKSIIGMLIPQLRGTLKAIEEGTYWQSYNCDSYFHLNDVLSPFLLRAVALLLEDYGYTAVPVHNPFYNHLGKKIRDDMPNGPDPVPSHGAGENETAVGTDHYYNWACDSWTLAPLIFEVYMCFYIMYNIHQHNLGYD